jgi:glyoxylase-like metal-dependent hydrolase (beta-lactamase superfamily II)
MSDVRAVEIGDHLYAIDAWMEGQPERLACYLFDTPERVLVEVGPSATLGHLIAALEELGVDDLAAFVVTHIHLDHAGGAGQMARRYPNAKVGVHTRGAKHLADPTRLWLSAVGVFGEQWLTTQWGPLEPVDTDRLMILDEADTIPLGGGRILDVMYTPGHAWHHIVFHDSETGGMFVGDSLGLCYPHGHFVQAVTPPPGFEPHEQVRQIHRMAERGPSFLGFAHFGPEYDVDAKLAEAEHRLDAWVHFIESIDGVDDDDAAVQLRRFTRDRYLSEGRASADIEHYAATTNWVMQVEGIRRWLAARPTN